MHVPHLVAEAIGWLAFEIDAVLPMTPTYALLLSSAISPIYTGAHASLTRPKSAAKPLKKKRDDQEFDDVEEEEDPEQHMEGMSTTDAFIFPVTAGIMLTGLYFLIKWLDDPALLNTILRWYFAGFSVFAISRSVSDGLDLLHSFLFPHVYRDGAIIFDVDRRQRLAIPRPSGAIAGTVPSRRSPLPSVFSRVSLPWLFEDVAWFLATVPVRRVTFAASFSNVFDENLKLGVHGIEGLLAGVSAVLYYNFVDDPWWLTNLVGFGFAYEAMQLISPTTFGTGSLLLGLLFFYDIYFVFFT
ncbi:hypothetical protein MRB53_038433 [Persea americana]|nr:hypothetical protein MRB53_038433 [Persea americana]